MKVNGKCHCGAIAYEATIDSAQAGICHCTDCQVFSGAPFRASAPAKAEHLRILRGTPQVYIKTADSGRKRAQGFCGTCGTSIYSTTPENPEIYNLRLGSLQQQRDITPRRQIWCDSAVPWVKSLADIPGIEKQ
jgi:hypothetical protein